MSLKIDVSISFTGLLQVIEKFSIWRIVFTGLPYGKPSLEMEGICSVFFFFFFFRVGKSLACHSPGKWYLCAQSLLCVFS